MRHAARSSIANDVDDMDMPVRPRSPMVCLLHGEHDVGNSLRHARFNK
jgi:hypothetical protein